MSVLLPAGRLTLWGLATVLCWVATLRLVNIIHVALAKRGLTRPPKHVMPPVERWNDLGFTLVALASGNATLIAFAGTAVEQLHIPRWLLPADVVPWLQGLRIILAGTVLLFFLTRLAENPRYKLAWAACWAVFSLGVVAFA